MKLKALLTASIATLLFTSGCVNVKPWERDALTDYTMRSDRTPIASAQAQHIQAS